MRAKVHVVPHDDVLHEYILTRYASATSNKSIERTLPHNLDIQRSALPERLLECFLHIL